MKILNNLAVLILAAGTSSRLGKPKQLVRYNNQTLLETVCKKALGISSDVFVVLGANYDECKLHIENLNVNVIKNENYKEGLSTSLKEGIVKVNPYDKCLVLLCDQPFIPKNHLESLVEKSKQNEKIICSVYKNDVAVPAVFPKSSYEKILRLNGDKGAKKIIQQSLHEVILLDDKYAIDIDKQDDMRYLK